MNTNSISPRQGQALSINTKNTQRFVRLGLCLSAVLALVSARPAQAITPYAVVGTLDDVENATLFIKARGTFWDFDKSTKTSGSWSGSGFILDKSGIAVTNNHVVAGASSFEVFVGNEKEARNAKVLGRSECSDLAVIQVTTEEDLPYLEWYSGTLKVGLTIYAAGHPLGDPEYTLTKGIISKAKANGNTSWASVKQVLEHDARINPGNSGGPLVTADGKLVGVNYAGSDKTRQSFAIARDEALSVLKPLRGGTDLDGIGISPEAEYLQKAERGGVWVTAVQSGSAADDVGLKPGDLILDMEDTPLASDGTLKEYCSILRSHRATDKINIKVYRSTTDDILEGQLNGRELKVTSPGKGSGNTTEATPEPKDTGNNDSGNTGETVSLKLSNTTGDDIHNLYVVEAGTDDWGKNQLKDGVVIKDGEDYTIDSIPAGSYDLRVTDQDDKSLGSLYNVGMQKDVAWTVTGLVSIPKSAKSVLEEPFAGNKNGWKLTSDKEIVRAISGGKLSVQIKTKNLTSWMAYEKTKLAGFFAEVNCGVDTEESGCGIGVAADNSNLIWFEIIPSRQEYSVLLLEKGEWQDDLIKTDTSTYIYPNGSNYMEIYRVGKKIQVYINASLAGEVETSKIPSGYLVFGGATRKTTPVKIVMDDLRLWSVK